MKRILIIYVTGTGSTAEVAGVMKESLGGTGIQVDLAPMNQAPPLEKYDGIVLGAPMKVGWHRSAIRFLNRHRAVLRAVPLAIFVMGVNFSSRGETDAQGIPIFLDKNCVKLLRKEEPVTLHENFSSVTRIARSILRASHPVMAVSLGFFGGRLEYHRLPLLEKLFVMLVIRAQPGDRRNWDAVRTWADSLHRSLVSHDAHSDQEVMET